MSAAARSRDAKVHKKNKVHKFVDHKLVNF